MAVNLNLPSRQTGTPEQQLNGLYSYLYQLVETLNVSLNKDTSDKKVLYKAGGGSADSTSSAVPDSIVQEYQQVKALIIKTATEVTSNIRKIVTEMTQEYKAQSEFGTYEEYLNNKITQGADGFLFEWDGTESVVSNVGNIGRYLAETDTYIRFGIVKHNDDGTFEAGIVVGKNFQKVTVDGKEYITSEDVYALFTAEEISFWQKGAKKSSLSLTGLVTTQAYVTELIAKNIVADKLETAQAYADALNAKKITAEQFAANVISAAKVSADDITAEKLSTASAYVDDLITSKITAKELATGYAKIIELKVDQLSATNGFIDYLTANNLGAEELTAAFAKLNELEVTELVATNAFIENLDAEGISAEELTALSAQIVDLYASQIIADIIKAKEITTEMLAANAVTAKKIAANTITAGQIAGKTITAEQIAANTITAGQIAGKTITADQIKGGTITANEIKGETITAGQIAADAVTTNKIKVGAVTTDRLAAKAVTADKVDVESLFASEATIEKLNTTDISSNESLRLMVDKLPIVKVYDGQFAQHECLADQAVRTYSEYLSAQGGSGDAAPDNVRKISGRTEGMLVRCGKNLCDMASMSDTMNNVTTELGDNTVRIYTSANVAYAAAKSPLIMLRKGQQYTLSADVTSLVKGNVRVCLRTETNTVISGTAITFTATGSKSITFTSSTDRLAYVSPMVTWSTAAAGDATFANIQLEAGGKATKYAPFSGSTYEAEFSEALYGGVLDWATGKVSKTWNYHSFKGTEDWRLYSSASSPYFYLQVGGEGYIDTSASPLCSHWSMVNVGSANSNIGFNVVNSSAKVARVVVRPGISSITSLATWKSYLSAQASAGTPVQVCYKVTAPEEAQLTEAHEVLCVEGLNSVYTDALSGAIEFGHDSLTSHLQAQINLIPGQITFEVSEGVKESNGYTDERETAILEMLPGEISLKVTGNKNKDPKEYVDGKLADAKGYTDERETAILEMLPGEIAINVSAGVKAGSSVTITEDEVTINSPTTTISIPVEDSDDGAEVVSIDEGGLRADIITADEIVSDSVVGTAAAKTYTPANAGELQAIFDDLKCRCMTGSITINADAVNGGSCTLRGLHGAGQLKISGGKLNELKLLYCSGCHIQIEGVQFESTGTAVMVQNAWAYLKDCDFNAEEGVYAVYNAHVVINGCTGKCTTLIRCTGASVVQVNGSTCPKGKLGSVSGEVYSTFEFTEADSAPTASEVTTTSISANSTRTWGGSWLSTSTFGTALYQGATGDGDLRMGCMWFPLTAISGKTIVSATLTLKRVSGIGGGGSVAIGIYGTTTASASGTPVRGTKYAEISLANGASGSVDVTNAVKALANGSIKGLMIYDGRKDKYHGKTYTYGYAKIYGTGTGVPTLSVTYK